MARIISYSEPESIRLSRTVAELIERGGVVGFPTETYYGLGVNPFNPTAVDRLTQIKGRPDNKPILVLIGKMEHLSLLTESVSPAAASFIDAFWPGPLTILFPAKPSLPSALTAGTGKVGVRLTSCSPLRNILTHVGPLTGTSANRSGAPPVTTAAEVAEALGSEIDLVIDGGATPGGAPSTVIDLGETIQVIREGAVTRAMLQTALRTKNPALTSTAALIGVTAGLLQGLIH
ncbi:L-threonylcarbamoyladenylate synthase [Candidatus Nitrospira inopinata]|jgi:L-threonylcarbamoyladenylate synthase|uniref:L-threonylcarbamoyladenylate synthase n=1 Tax=Candidatus Nitrospira inopinata TaxID=1715989 RepID=A0A0S4KYX2_9BACT|nr:L-threonylcarbamoyladenylate synthase [Candidatus Nitrospira inopinata]CUQ67643.1 putative dsRNA-binding protein, predicted ribosome maturation factor [Candidatus Nitrospira inopinata]